MMFSIIKSTFMKVQYSPQLKNLDNYLNLYAKKNESVDLLCKRCVLELIEEIGAFFLVFKKFFQNSSLQLEKLVHYINPYAKRKESPYLAYKKHVLVLIAGTCVGFYIFKNFQHISNTSPFLNGSSSRSIVITRIFKDTLKAFAVFYGVSFVAAWVVLQWRGNTFRDYFNKGSAAFISNQQSPQRAISMDVKEINVIDRANEDRPEERGSQKSSNSNYISKIRPLPVALRKLSQVEEDIQHKTKMKAFDRVYGACIKIRLELNRYNSSEKRKMLEECFKKFYSLAMNILDCKSFGKKEDIFFKNQFNLFNQGLLRICRGEMKNELAFEIRDGEGFLGTVSPFSSIEPPEILKRRNGSSLSIYSDPTKIPLEDLFNRCAKTPLKRARKKVLYVHNKMKDKIDVCDNEKMQIAKVISEFQNLAKNELLNLCSVSCTEGHIILARLSRSSEDYYELQRECEKLKSLSKCIAKKRSFTISDYLDFRSQYEGYFRTVNQFKKDPPFQYVCDYDTFLQFN